MEENNAGGRKKPTVGGCHRRYFSLRQLGRAMQNVTSLKAFEPTNQLQVT
jgi:hypothetical protein